MQRVGALMSAVNRDRSAGRCIAASKKPLHQLGWIDGRNLRLEVRWAGADSAKARKDAEGLVAFKRA